MSTALLAFLRDAYAFAGTPNLHDLGAYHVPFDELLGVVSVEGRLGRGARIGERIAVIGSGGTGKSSVIAHTLGPGVEDVWPVRVPLTSLRGEAGEPVAVLDRLVQVVADTAAAGGVLPGEEAATISQSVRPHDAASHKTTRASITMGPPGLKGTLAREVEVQARRAAGLPPEQKIEAVQQILGLLSGRDDLQPVLVFDDTDRWVSPDTRGPVPGFFTEVLRMMAELPASLVVAVHPHYLERFSRRQVLAHLDTIVEVPALPDGRALQRVLDQRVRVHVRETEFDGAGTGDVFDRHAVTALFRYYSRRGVALRHVIQVAHQALVDAADQGQSRVTSWFVHGGIALG